MGQRLAPAVLSLLCLVAPAGGLAVPLPAHAQDPPTWRYKVKVSEGTAWTNLQPESWVMFDVTGRTVVVQHSTFTLNAITSRGKWWNHPLTELRACRLAAGPSGDPLPTCLRGESPAPGDPLQVVLPQGVTIHDLLFRVRWQERGQQQEATLRVPPEVRPTEPPRQ